jgi:alpha-L-fucosidase 2
MKWDDGTLQQATITSRIGGTLRVRSYQQLQGRGLRAAEGACPNPLLAPAAIREPLRSPELKDFELLPVRQVYEYDVELKPGEKITLNKL